MKRYRESSGSVDRGPGWHDCSGGAPARAWRYRVCGRLGEYAGSGMSCPSGIPSVALRTSRDISAGIDNTVSRSYGSGAVILSLQHRSFLGLYRRHPRRSSWHRDSLRRCYTGQMDKELQITEGSWVSKRALLETSDCKYFFSVIFRRFWWIKDNN